MSPPPDSTQSVEARVRELCDRGLEKFRAGDVGGAMLDWDRARLLDPHATAPDTYIQRVARGLDPGEDEVPSGIRVSLEPGEEDLDLFEDPEADEYEIELTAGEPEADDDAGSGAAQESFQRAAFAAFDDVDAGWSLDDEAAALPPPPNEHRAPSANLGGVPQVPAAVMGVPDDALSQQVDDEVDLDLLPGAPPAAEVDQRAGTLDFELPPVDQHLAVTRQGAAETMDLLPQPDLAHEYDDVPPTRELQRPPEVQPEPEDVHDSDSDITVPGGGGEVSPAGSLNLSEDALRALSGTGDGVPPEETTVERPGMVKRGLALPELEGLDELDLGARRDDRHEEEPADVRVTFRESTSPGLDDELTTERGAMSGYDERSTTDSELTVERGPTRPIQEVRADLGVDDELTVERPSQAGGTVSASVADGLPDAGRDPDEPWAAVRDRIRDQVSGTLSERLQGDERVRHWVSSFIDRARLELDRGDTELAATALELALSEAPESAVAQKLIHRHRELLIEIYEAYLGDTGAMPVLAVPMHELGGQDLDSRAVFLLSRIDGTLAIEEIVDVSGMTTIEAYRHLARLLLQGILEVR